MLWWDLPLAAPGLVCEAAGCEAASVPSGAGFAVQAPWGWRAGEGGPADELNCCPGDL